jgi:putative membrane protein
MRREPLLLLAVALLAMLGCQSHESDRAAMGQESDTYAYPRTDDAQPSRVADWGADSGFLHEAAEGGRMEVELGRLAADRAESQRVRDFGRRMVEDHSRAGDDLGELIRGKGGQPPDALGRASRDEVTRLGNLTGVRFDREYMRMMVEDHDKDVTAFEHEASGGRDAAARGFASSTLPMLREHQRLAREIADEIGAIR